MATTSLPKLPLPIYYIVTAVFSGLLFFAAIALDSTISGFLSSIMKFALLVPLALAGMSILYYFKDTDYTDTGLGLKIGKGLYYIVLLAAIALTAILTFFAGSAVTGWASIGLDLLFVFALIEGYLSYANWQTVAAEPLIVETVPAAPQTPPTA